VGAPREERARDVPRRSRRGARVLRVLSGSNSAPDLDRLPRCPQAVLQEALSAANASEPGSDRGRRCCARRDADRLRRVAGSGGRGVRAA
jgi:hypothetical protein